MIRCAAILSLFALAACAEPAPQPPSPQAVEASEVYHTLTLLTVERQMLPDDNRLTYGYAVVNCGLRDQKWLDLLRQVYSEDYRGALRQHPLTPTEIAEAQVYASAHVSNPSPPPYICQRLADDSTLADLDNSIAVESLILTDPKRTKQQG